jgi:adenine-specific DNA methylase/transcription elongation factor Elf1
LTIEANKRDKKNSSKIKAIEKTFPIFAINRLVIPERSSFRPIYKITKWFARRSSSAFRAILLASILSEEKIIMDEFYRKQDFNELIILDPFMGGGTTIVEALKMNCRVIGIDLNPIAWFTTKAEISPVTSEEIKKASKMIEQSIAKKVRYYYTTSCPVCCKKAEVIYYHWAKKIPCYLDDCESQTLALKNYILDFKKFNVRYIEYHCSDCKRTFDLDFNQPTITGKYILCSSDHAGIDRDGIKVSFLDTGNGSFNCPYCGKDHELLARTRKKLKKKVLITIILCPNCKELVETRGTVPDEVECPICNKNFDPSSGTIPKKGHVSCKTCDHVNKVIKAIRKSKKPAEPELIAITGYCPHCEKNSNRETKSARKLEVGQTNAKLLKDNRFKFWKKVEESDRSLYQEAVIEWMKKKELLPIPGTKVADGEKTRTHVIGHGYTHWNQLFNSRQLLCLGKLLKSIQLIEDVDVQEALLAAFMNMLNSNNIYTRYNRKGNKLEGIFARHDFHPTMTFVEGNVWGSTKYGRGTFANCLKLVYNGKDFIKEPYEVRYNGNKREKVYSGETIKISSGNPREIFSGIKNSSLLCISSTDLSTIEQKVDLIITDPPYADNVNYAELADFFYSWLRLVLKDRYEWFKPENTVKSEEVVANKFRYGKNAKIAYADKLTRVFKECYAKLDDEGLLVFTFHHKKQEAWIGLFDALLKSGFYLVQTYPIHSEASNTLNIENMDAITQDVIHACKKRISEPSSDCLDWFDLKRIIEEDVSEIVTELGKKLAYRMSEPDLKVILIGKILEYFSRYNGLVHDKDGKVMKVTKAIDEVGYMISSIKTKNINPS